MASEGKGGVGRVLADIGRSIGDFFSGGKLEGKEQIFVETLFVLLGQVARADGVVTAQEAALGERVIDQLQLNATGRRAAVEQFDRGRHQKLDIHGELKRFNAVFPPGTAEARKLFDFVIMLAAIDGRIRPGEKTVLVQITEALGYPLEALEAQLVAATPGPIG